MATTDITVVTDNLCNFSFSDGGTMLEIGDGIGGVIFLEEEDVEDLLVFIRTYFPEIEDE